MRFVGTCYRAHDPRWSFQPLSGAGAAVRGARFNPKGTPALYLALDLVTAVAEANQGFALKLSPCLLCSYEVDCEDIADLRDDVGRRAHAVQLADMSCTWALDVMEGREPASWRVVARLKAEGCAGLLAPSFAPGAGDGQHNLVLWAWSDRLPHKVVVHDPSGRLPKNQLSWPEP